MPWSEFTICDVFTDRPPAGNQLAVFPEAPAIDPRLLARLAHEINFAETVDGPRCFGLRSVPLLL